MSFGSRYDSTVPVLSSTFLNYNQFQTKENVSITPSHSKCNVSFAENYLFVQTPQTPRLENSPSPSHSLSIPQFKSAVLRKTNRVHDKFLTVTAAQANANVNSEISELKQQIGELADLFKQFGSEKKIRYQVNPGQVHQNTQYQPHGRTGPSCYNCNGNGHTKRYCNWNGTGNVCPDVACQICKQMGHTALQCLKFCYQDKHTNEICQLCFQVGHVAANCKKFQSNVYYNQNSGNRTVMGDARHGLPGQ